CTSGQNKDYDTRVGGCIAADQSGTGTGRSENLCRSGGRQGFVYDLSGGNNQRCPAADIVKQRLFLL
ncbi:MAG TPA: hypothetical protein VJU02_02485, partial [Nitrospiraceae bacterium]|nr:hypothetical protein [Nitrospiraceae bacterium]